MKAFSVAVLVAVVLTCICIQESSTVPAIEMHEVVEAVADGSLVSAEQEMPEDSWKMAYELRHRSGRRRKRCRFCCECCPGMIGRCGTCCKF